MMHLIPFAFCIAGFATLAAATRRRQRDIFNGPLRPATTAALRVMGASLLLLALGHLVTRQGWSLGLVIFSGDTSLAAGIVYCALIGWQRMATRGARP